MKITTFFILEKFLHLNILFFFLPHPNLGRGGRLENGSQ